MSKRSFHFLSGRPRSGSILPSGILRQNPRFHAGMNRPIEFDARPGAPGLRKVKAQLTLTPPDLFDKFNTISIRTDKAGSAANAIAVQPLAQQGI